jgi:1-phosphatidylinositol-4-phosphate 5-kinase
MMEENESNFQVEERKIDREEAGSPQHLWESAVGSVVHGAATVKQKATDIKAKTQHAAATVAVKAKEQLSVFGAAPSLATMKSLNQLGKGNKNMFVCAEFWYKFRLYYPIFAPLSFIIGLIFATTLWNTENGHMLIAALLSFLSCVSVCASYIMILPWRRHPSTIVFYRAGVNMFFSFLVICMAIAYNSNPDEKCNGYAVSVEFALISGECWLTTIALDLVLSLTNPFTSYKGNMKRYHSITWVFAIILSFALYNQPACQKRFESGFCWVSDTSCFIGYYVFWIVAMYIYQFGAIIFAFLRLRKGLPTTFQVRSKIATETFKCLAVYGCYLFFMCILLIVLGSRPESSDHSTNWNNFRKVFLFFVCSRGFVDGVVWFMQHEFAADEKPIKIQKVPTNDIQEDDEENVVRNVILEESGEKFDSNNFDAEFDKNMERRVQMRRRTSSFSSINSPERRRSKIHDVADAIAEVVEITAGNQGFDESDLSPQVNLALRQQIVKFVTMGVTLSARKDYTLGTVMTNPIEKAINQAIDYVKELIIPKDPRLENLQVIEFLLLDEHPFKEFAHDIFRDIRAAEGIDEDYYLAALQKTEREQLSEGASGAFMFFCGGGDFLVKTINANEADVLHRSLEIYRDYLRENPDSLLVRFLGSYSLKVYAQTFHFVVMRNIFEPGTDVNERFDIKGSWVNRSAAPPMPNKRVVCRHCNEMFTPAAQEMCSKIIGKHEANVVLKDNDLRVKISLRSQDACTILDIIKKDSDLLAELGVLDYR